MTLTYLEQLDLQNNKEHLQIVLDNLRIANGELSSVLVELKIAKSILESLKTERGDVISDIESRKKVINEKENVLIEKEISLNKQELDLNDKRSDIALELEKLQAKMQTVLNDISFELSNHNKIIEDKKKEIAELDNNILSLKEKNNEQKDTANKISEDIKKLENERDRINSEIEEKSKTSERTRISLEAELEDTRRRVDIELERVSVPMEQLKLQESVVDRKLKNLEIIKKRLTKQFRVQNPDAGLPIDLQDEQ